MILFLKETSRIAVCRLSFISQTEVSLFILLQVFVSFARSQTDTKDHDSDSMSGSGSSCGTGSNSSLRDVNVHKFVTNSADAYVHPEHFTDHKDKGGPAHTIMIDTPSDKDLAFDNQVYNSRVDM